MGDQALYGAAKLIAQLKELGELDSGKAVRAAARAGMKPALKEARIRIPISEKPHKTYKGNLVQPGFAKKSLHIEVTTSADRTSATALLGPTKEAFYATTFVEIGTARAAPHPWLRPAFYSTQEQQKMAMVESLRKFLEKAASS